jgi:hypothetical protein
MHVHQLEISNFSRILPLIIAPDKQVVITGPTSPGG